MHTEEVSVFLTPTNNCNLACRCPNPNMAYRKFMDPAVVSRVLEEIADDPLFDKRVTWSEYGESFLHAHNFEMLENAKSLGLSIYLFTNLTLLSPDDLDRLARIMGPGDVIHLNLEWGARVYEQTRRNSRYDKKLTDVFFLIERNKRKAPEQRSRIEVWSIDYDIVTDEDRATFFRDIGEICARRNLVHRFDEKSGVPDEHADVFFVNRCESNWKDFTKYFGEPVCVGMRSPQLHIHANGSVVICCHDWHAESAIGNVHRRSLRQIWESSELADLYTSIEERSVCHKVCRRCLKLPALEIFPKPAAAPETPTAPAPAK